MQYLPIADVAVLQFLAPVFVAAGAPLLLGELPPRGVWAALPTCLLGVVLVAQPTFLFGGEEPVSGLGVAIGVLQVRLLSLLSDCCADIFGRACACRPPCPGGRASQLAPQLHA